MIDSIRKLPGTTQRLLWARFFRSLGQGALTVDFALYLHALKWNGAAIGAVLSGGGLVGALLALLVGYVGDRMRRKPLVQSYQVLTLACGVVAAATAQPIPLVIAAILASFGRGANGAAGPFSPAEQAWLSETIPARERGSVYNLTMALGFLGMALGSLLAMLPAFWHGWLPGALSYRPLFVLVAVLSLVTLVVLLPAQESYVPQPEAPAEHITRRRENRALAKLVIINGFNGLAIGLTGPLIPYWFALKFGMGPQAIAPVMAATFAATSLAAILSGRLAQRVGLVNSVVAMRGMGTLLLFVLPLAPVYWTASLVYLLRSCFNRGSAGSRQALAIGLVRQQRRSLAASLNVVSFQLPQAAGPVLSGLLFDTGNLALPFYVGAALQGIYLALFGWAFRHAEGKSDDSLPSSV